MDRNQIVFFLYLLHALFADTGSISQACSGIDSLKQAGCAGMAAPAGASCLPQDKATRAWSTGGRGSQPTSSPTCMMRRMFTDPKLRVTEATTRLFLSSSSSNFGGWHSHNESNDLLEVESSGNLNCSPAGYIAILPPQSNMSVRM